MAPRDLRASTAAEYVAHMKSAIRTIAAFGLAAIGCDLRRQDTPTSPRLKLEISTHETATRLDVR